MYLSMQDASSALHDTHASYDFFFVDRTILPLYCKIVPKLANNLYQILTSSPRKFSGFDFTPPLFASLLPPLSLRLYENQHSVISVNPTSHSRLPDDSFPQYQRTDPTIKLSFPTPASNQAALFPRLSDL